MIKLINVLCLIFIVLSCTKDDFTFKIRKRPCVLNPKWNDGDYFINKVEFGGIVNQTGVSPYHHYYKENTALVQRGNILVLNIGYSFVDLVNSMFIYFDWNRDGDFDDSEEVVYQNFNISGSTLTLNIQVPSNAEKGLSTMRVLVRGEYETTIQDPCYDTAYGEAEDYQIKIY